MEIPTKLTKRPSSYMDRFIQQREIKSRPSLDIIMWSSNSTTKKMEAICCTKFSTGPKLAHYLRLMDGWLRESALVLP